MITRIRWMLTYTFINISLMILYSDINKKIHTMCDTIIDIESLTPKRKRL